MPPAIGPLTLMAIGAAAAMCLSNFVSNWLVGGVFARAALGCRWRDLLDWGFLARTVGACGVAVIAANWALSGPQALEPEGAARVIGHVTRIAMGIAVYGAVFAALAFPLRIVTRDDLEALRKLVRR